MEPLLLSKSYKFLGHPASKGAIVVGSVHIDPDGLYLLYRSHTWQTGTVAGAAFGLIGALIHALATRKRPFELPVEDSPVAELPEDILRALHIKKTKPADTLAVIPREAVLGYKKSMTKGLRFQLEGCELVPIGTKSRVVRQLESLGYAPVEP
ncbi:MAG: hypothetical protein AAGI68_02770 [Planctomycetota bacterium]